MSDQPTARLIVSARRWESVIDALHNAREFIGRYADVGDEGQPNEAMSLCIQIDLALGEAWPCTASDDPKEER